MIWHFKLYTRCRARVSHQIQVNSDQHTKARWSLNIISALRNANGRRTIATPSKYSCRPRQWCFLWDCSINASRKYWKSFTPGSEIRRECSHFDTQFILSSPSSLIQISELHPYKPWRTHVRESDKKIRPQSKYKRNQDKIEYCNDPRNENDLKCHERNNVWIQTYPDREIAWWYYISTRFVDDQSRLLED